MKIKSHKPHLAEADMTPMIDMTFQLIAFFMIVSNFEQTLADERVKLPADMLARPPIAPREHEVVINVGFLRNPDGSKVNNQALIFYSGADAAGQSDIPLSEFRPLFQREFNIMKRQHGEEVARDTLISIRADADTPTGLIQELIKMGQEVGFTKFALKAKQGESEDD